MAVGAVLGTEPEGRSVYEEIAALRAAAKSEGMANPL
jgi:hypothetical protein